MKKFLLSLFLAIPLFLFSQEKLVPGFIIKRSEDTVKGYVSLTTEKRIEDRILFSTDLSSSPATYTLTDITSFGYAGGNSYDKVIFTDPADSLPKERFAKRLVEGYYRLYMFWKQDKRFFVLNTYRDSTYLLYDDNTNSLGFSSEKGNYMDKLLFLSVNCDAVRKSLDGLGYTEKDMSNYVNRLNDCLQPSEQNAIVYKKNKSRFGLYAYAGGFIAGSKYEYTGRIIAKFTLPALDNNTSLNTGINYMTNKRTHIVKNISDLTTSEKAQYRNIVSIPMTIQYSFTQGIIRPYVDAGLSLDYIETKTQHDYDSKYNDDKRSGLGVIFSAGIEGYITHRLMVKADWRYELFAHYPTIGIGYHFVK
ncbi:MAG: outer membrane beta-barrel protein [Chitinophagaceae bacterium]